MPEVTVADVLKDAAALLGDPTATVFTAEDLMPFFGMAFREISSLVQRWGLPQAEQTAYYLIPAYSSRFVPAQVGIADFGEPIEIAERGNVTAVPITLISDTTPMAVTLDGVAPQTNSEVFISGPMTPAAAVGRWFWTKTGASAGTLNGSIAAGEFSGDATLQTSNEKWIPVVPVEDLPQVDPGDALRMWSYEDDTIEFPGATTARQIRLKYESSGVAPASGTIGFTKARDFLSVRTASLMAPTRQAVTDGANLKEQALGPSGEADGTGGLIRQVVLPMLLEQQKRPRRPQPFRPRRLMADRLIY